MELSLTVLIIAQVLGLISWLLLLYSYTKEDIDDLLFIQIFVAIFDVASYLLLGADAGMFICLLEFVEVVLYYKTDKDRLIFKVSVVSYILISLLTFDHWFACLPVLGSIIDSYGASKDSKSANIASIVSNTIWMVYDLIILSFVGAATDLAVVMCNISVLTLGYSRILRISKFRIVKESHLTRKTVDQIYNLDLKNFGEDNVWDKDYQLQVFKKNNDSLFLIKYKYNFVGYINYLNMIPEEYESLKRKRTMPDYMNIESITPFKQKKKSYLVIESINVKKEYERDKTIELINKKIKSFIRTKKNRKIYINGILGYALSDFEKQLYEDVGFTKIKDLEDNISLYELDLLNIKKYLSA